MAVNRLAPDPNQTSRTVPSHREMANAIRVLAMDAVEKAQSGHPGMPMGMADVATVLVRHFLKFDAAAPDWPDRDRLVLSAGHGSMLLYALLYLTGYADMPIEELERFRQLGSRTAGHPEYGHAKGIETTTGPLGQGLANAVGMAIGERHLAAHFGDDLVNHYTYVLAGDGCLMEGISHEAISLAGHLRLHKLIVLFDDNQISIDGPTSLAVSDDQLQRFEAAGWETTRIDGHDPDAVFEALTQARQSDRPSLIACRTTIGYGAPKKAGTAATHGAPLGAEEVAGTRAALGWTEPPFVVPDAILKAWRALGAQGGAIRQAWEAKRDGLAPKTRDEFERRQGARLPKGWDAGLQRLKDAYLAETPSLATRKASEQALGALAPVLPELVGGSADLTGSNNTKTADQKPLSRDDYGGTYLYYGVREHAMAAAMNGLALHGGVLPYGGTFLTFTDYCRPAIRLSALMELGVIYVMTHDSIGLGEDGPTHQPIEHLASLRAIPNLCVLRPADAVETAECWELAIRSRNRPSILALTRQGLPTLRKEKAKENLSAKGAYLLVPSKGEAKVTLFATGSEVSIAVAAHALLVKDGIGARVVSMPCWELFEEQDDDYRQEVLGSTPVRVGIEAAISMGWERYLGPDGLFIGMSGFGASAPAKALFQHFGITPEAVADAVRQRLS
ncbi:MAG: transketolase [Alphaproteobacteria bacterium]|nr:transketolase [Alphaproteobacteria bacterium]